MPDEIIGREVVYRGWFDVSRVTLRLATGEVIERQVVENPSGAVVLPYDPERCVALLLNQTRPPLLLANAPPLPEPIGGALDGDTPEACARRELREEAGLDAHDLEEVACVWPNASTSTERVTLYLARYAKRDRVEAGGGLLEEAEHIRLREWPLAELWRMVEACAVHDAKLLTLLQALKLRRPELFGAA